MMNCQEPAKLLFPYDKSVVLLQQHCRRGSVPCREEQKRKPDKPAFFVDLIISGLVEGGRKKDI